MAQGGTMNNYDITEQTKNYSMTETRLHEINDDGTMMAP